MHFQSCRKASIANINEKPRLVKSVFLFLKTKRENTESEDYSLSWAVDTELEVEVSFRE